MSMTWPDGFYLHSQEVLLIFEFFFLSIVVNFLARFHWSCSYILSITALELYQVCSHWKRSLGEAAQTTDADHISSTAGQDWKNYPKCCWCSYITRNWVLFAVSMYVNLLSFNFSIYFFHYMEKIIQKGLWF